MVDPRASDNHHWPERAVDNPNSHLVPRETDAASEESAQKGTDRGAATLDAVKGAARQAKRHINPVLVQHSLEAAQDALLESKVAKVDRKTGKLKVSKFGVAKAVIMPTQTLRKAADGVGLTDRLKSYNEAIGALPSASSAAEFASYPAKQDFLKDWARRLLIAAGVTPTMPLVDAWAIAVADSVMVGVLLPMGVQPPGPPVAFDSLYSSVVQSLRDPRQVDEQIVAFLNHGRGEWMQYVQRQQA